MKNIYPFFRGWLSLSLIPTLFYSPLAGQNLQASPQNIVRPLPPNTLTVTLHRSSGGWSATGDFSLTVSPSTGVVVGTYSSTSTDLPVTFTAAAAGIYTFQLTKGSSTATTTVVVGNLAACSANGYTVSAFNVLNGNYQAGPSAVFSPLTQTAALGISASGYYYYMPRDFYGNHGHVTLFAARPDGTGSTGIASIDLNGNNDNDLGFVRLAIDPTGNGWLLAGDDSNLFLAKFATNGINPTTITMVDASVALVNGSVATFRNGDICFSGTGTLYAMANVTNGVTQIFSGQPNGSSTILTKKWDLVNENGNYFSGTVNGVAFDALGSLYISTGTGLYYINQSTVNSATGTVQCALVKSVSGLTDLGSNVFPLQSALPVKLLSFAGTYRNQKSLLSWEATDAVAFDHFDVERSSDGIQYKRLGEVTAFSQPSVTNYQFADDLSNSPETVFTYRLKMVDKDGRFSYSSVVLIQKSNDPVKGLAISPNPVSGNSVSLRFYSAAAEKTEIRIVDLSGRLLLRQTEMAVQGNNSIIVNSLDRLSAGNYVLYLVTPGSSVSTKFIRTQ